MKDIPAYMLLVNPSNGDDWHAVSVSKSKDILDALGCRVFSFHIITIQGVRIFAYYDAEELLIDRLHRPVLFDTNKRPLVYGRVLLGMPVEHGNDATLTTEALTAISNNVVRVNSCNESKFYYAIGGVTW